MIPEDSTLHCSDNEESAENRGDTLYACVHRQRVQARIPPIRHLLFSLLHPPPPPSTRPAQPALPPTAVTIVITEVAINHRDEEEPPSPPCALRRCARDLLFAKGETPSRDTRAASRAASSQAARETLISYVATRAKSISPLPACHACHTCPPACVLARSASLSLESLFASRRDKIRRRPSYPPAFVIVSHIRVRLAE